MTDTLRWAPIDLRADLEEPEHRGDPAELIDAAAFVREMLDRPAWQADAACREHPELSWFPGRGEDVMAPKTVCTGCLVADECARYAIDQGHHLEGIWGGTSTGARRTLQRSFQAPANPAA